MKKKGLGKAFGFIVFIFQRDFGEREKREKNSEIETLRLGHISQDRNMYSRRKVQPYSSIKFQQSVLTRASRTTSDLSTYFEAAVQN